MARDSRRQANKSGPPRAFYWTFACVLVAFAFAVYTQARVQVVRRDTVLKMAEEAWLLSRSREIPAERGTIYSADGRILAQSRSLYEFWLFYDRVPCTPGFFMALAEASGVPEARLSAPYRAGKKRAWLEPLDADRYRAVRRVMAEWGADGVSLAEQFGREYTMREAALPVVGWMFEGKARSGIERSFDEALSGVDGRSSGVVALTGQYMASAAEESGLEHGSDVVLTIDSKLQSTAANAIRTAVEKNRASSGAIVVMAPATGDVLAMANWPSFDPAAGPKGGSEMMASYMEDLQPGSTFKILTLAKALDMGVVDDSFSTNCAGEYSLGGSRRVRCDLHAGSRAHGQVDLEHAIGRSCNIAAAQWALKIGREPMIAYIRELGLLSRPELGLPSAATPQFDMNEWDKERQLAVLGFGQSIAVPPISLAAACAMIANDGEYVAPRLVSQVGGKRIPPSAPKRVVSQRAARQVRRYMESVMHEPFGTGKSLAIPGYRMAGKTGTAQKLGVNDGHVSNFVGMFPAERPQVLVMVVVNDPRGQFIYGAQVAGPAFKDMAEAVASRLGIPRSAESAVASNKER
jgi:cell division protein FtsI/penicillin-binding protein 2